MNYRKFKTADFIANEYFIHWVKTPDEEADDFWNNWLDANPDKQEEIYEARQFIEKLDFPQSPLSKSQRLKMLHNINAQIELDEQKTKLSTLNPNRFWSKMIAACFIGMLAIASWYFYQNRTIEYATVYEELKYIDLPDGSKVTLNANSSFQTKGNWKDLADREVWLEGEAFFEVNAEPIKGNRKFIVHVGDLDVEVLGTKFNVYTRANHTKVVLTEGHVNLALKGGSSLNKMDMKPGEMSIYLAKEKRLNKSIVNTDVHTSWKSDVLVFDNTPLSHILDILQFYYGFEVKVENKKLLDRKLTGDIANENFEDLLKAISTAFNVKVKQKDDHYIYIEE